MPELIAKANQAILESQHLRREGRSLRFEASVRASQLGQTILKSRDAKKEAAEIRASLDQAFSKP
jgi:hypothetical protein